jgi:hypothetical protein
MFKGLGPPLESDDTLILFQANPNMMEALKWTLQGFELISGLKVNYAKNDLLLINLSYFS